MSRFFLFFLIFLCSKSSAQVYVEVGPSFVSYQNKFGPSNIKTNQKIAKLLIGYESTNTWSGEFLTGLSQLSEGSVYLNDKEIPNMEIKFKSAYGVYLRSNHLLCNDLKLFGRLGYASVSGSGSYQSLTEKFESSGASYGFGLSRSLGRTQYLSIDYLSFMKKNEMEINALSISYGINF